MWKEFYKNYSHQNVPFCVHQPSEKLGITDMTNGASIFPPNIPNNAVGIHAYLTISDRLSLKTSLYLRFIPRKSVTKTYPRESISHTECNFQISTVGVSECLQSPWDVISFKHSLDVQEPFPKTNK